jgi:integrase
MPRKKKQAELPKYVHLKNGDWYVGINFPTAARRASGAIIYDQHARRCFPETAERALELATEITESYKANSSSNPNPESQTVNRYLEVFLEAKRKSLARRTIEFYTEQYDWYVKKSAFGVRLLADIKPLDIQKFYDDLQTGGATSGCMIRKLHQFLSTAFNQAVLWESILKNPVKGVILPKKQKPDTHAMTGAEVKTFLGECKKTNKNIVFEFALETAMRPEEYLALTWDDIDLDRQTVTVRRALAVGFKGGGFEFKETKTDGSNRTMTFSTELASRLELHREIQKKTIARLKEKEKKTVLLKHIQKKGKLYARRVKRRRTAALLINNYAEFNLIFPSATGTPMSRLNLNRRDFKAVLKSANLDTKRFSLYSLRRTTATLLASKINPKELAAFLGHTDVATSMKFYVMITDDSKYKATNAMSAFLYD